jgi:N-acetylmuramoyl-L-alanine amidase
MKKLFVTICCLIISFAAVSQNPASFRLVKTTGKLPHLEYGPGDDRLGGAKMTYLDTNILLTVIDSFESDYIVRLSNQHKAFITKESVASIENKTAKPYYLSGNWKVFGDSIYDYLTIAMPEKLPYKSQMQIEPSRIVIDLYGITSNTNWITQLNTAKEISRAWYEQVEDDVLRVYISLRHQQHWGYFVFYDSVSPRLTVRVKRQPLKMDIRALKIAIDAGHGGENIGSSGLNSKVLEKDYCLLIARSLASQLKKSGVKKVYMTRIIDTTLSMPERVHNLRMEDPDLLISIHLNSSGFDTVKGASTFYRYIGYKSLTTAVLKRMLELKLTEYGNVGSFNFALNGPTEYPNCLVEVAFLSNPEDEKKILDPGFHKKVAIKIEAGIKDWLGTLKK